MNIDSQPEAREAHDALLGQVTKALRERKDVQTIWLDHPANLYLTEYQSDVYLELMTNKDYAKAFHDPVRELIQEHAELLVSGLAPPIDILDLGPGYPDKTFPILELLHAKGFSARYLPVDVNPTFLHIAKEAVSSFGFPVIPLRCLFEHLPNRLNSINLRTSSSRLVLLGLTFMNYRPTAIVPFLRKLARKRDAVVVAAELTDHRNRLELIEPYRTDQAETLNMSVIKLLGISVGSVSYLARMLSGRIEMGFRLTKDVELNSEIRLPKGLKIITAISYRYSSRELKRQLQQRFPYVRIFVDSEKRVAIAKCGLSLETRIGA